MSKVYRAVAFLGRLGFVCFGFLAVWMVSALVIPTDAAWPWYVYCIVAGGCAMVCMACLNVAGNADDRIEEMEVWGRC